MLPCKVNSVYYRGWLEHGTVHSHPFLLSDGDQGVPQLFRVQNANLRARVALQALENWPLSAGRELLEFCLNDPGTESSLRTDLEVKKKELDVYHWVILVS